MSTDKARPALLVFSIGPVQDFIATARRTQDLWMGSYILSYLIAHAMRQVVTDPADPKEILFPTPKDQPLIRRLWLDDPNVEARQLTLATLPNKFTARFDSFGEAEQRAQAAEEAVHLAWRKVALAVQAKFPGTLIAATEDWKNLWEQQTDPRRWIEVYWVVHPYDETKHGDSNRRAEEALAARKRLRNFGWADERGEKCTVCGTRAALGSKPELRRSELRGEWESLATALHALGESDDQMYRGLAAALSGEGDERLCAICATKRFAQRFFLEDKAGLKSGFPSTSSVASAIFRRDVMAPELGAARDAFVKALKDDGIPRTLAERAFPTLGKHDLQRYDGDLFYPDTYTAKRLKDDYGVEFSETKLKQLRAALGRLRTAAKEADIDLPPTYYAVLLMDGDHMGDRLRRAAHESEHRQISEALRQFALKVQDIVEGQYLGRVVYAGGDDLMAFLPLEYALDAANDLSREFRQVGGLGLMNSAGIAIAHHLAPLDIVLKAARRAEKAAKDRYGRNAIIVTVLKRSGEQLDVGAHWQDGGLDMLILVREVRDRFRSDRLSSKIAFEAEAEARAIEPLGRAAHEAMLARLIKRHGPAGDPDLARQLADLGEGLRGHALPEATNATLEVARWLLLARFLVVAAKGEE